MEVSFTRGYHIPFCEVWIGTRSGEPISLGDSLKKTGIFKNFNSDPIDRSLVSVSVEMEASQPNQATIEFIDTFGFLDVGIHAGVDCFIKMGYSSTDSFTGIGEKRAKLVMVGVVQRPTVNFNPDGTIVMSIKIKDKCDALRYNRKTRRFKDLTRGAIIQKVFEPYLGKIFDMPVVEFLSMNTEEKLISQARMTDMEFLYHLARKWECAFDTRVEETSLKLIPFFVDNTTSGDALMGTFDPAISGKGVAYKMDWRTGINNLKSASFSGEVSATAGEGGGVLQRKEDGEMVVVDRPIEHSGDPHDPSNWEIDEAKVNRWLRNNKGKSEADFRMIAFAMPQAERHKLFYSQKEKAKVPRPGGTPSTSPVTEAGLGAGGYEGQFELVRGDPFLCPNTPVELGGDVYGMFKSGWSGEAQAKKEHLLKVAKNKISAMVGAEGEEVEPRTSINKDILYWRVVSVAHIFSSAGLNTSGKVIR